MLGQRWANACNSGPTLNRQWFNVCCLLEFNLNNIHVAKNITPALVECVVFAGVVYREPQTCGQDPEDFRSTPVCGRGMSALYDMLSGTPESEIVDGFGDAEDAH